jgi:hypothetical protein
MAIKRIFFFSIFARLSVPEPADLEGLQNEWLTRGRRGTFESL